MSEESNMTRDPAAKNARGNDRSLPKKELEPCDRPQAAEVSRLQADDEACDDGVN